jgi:uncharacterized protein
MPALRRRSFFDNNIEPVKTIRCIPALSLLALSLTAVVCRAEEKAKPPVTTGTSSVWKVESGGHHIYLAGTIHLMRATDYPLPDVFDQAYNDSSKIVLELPPGSEGDGEVIIRMRQLGSYGAGDELSKHLSEATMKRVTKWAEDNTFPLTSILRFKPWFLALTISAMEYKALGAEAARGVDSHYQERAADDGKPGEGLESVEYQLSLFSRLDDKMQEELLLQTLSEIESMQKDFEEMLTSWRMGDMPKLQAFLLRDADKYPELMEQFLYRRNKSWVAPLEKYLSKGEQVMVLVGAGHLGGKQGILELLKAKGCKVTQLKSEAKPPKG